LEEERNKEKGRKEGKLRKSCLFSLSPYSFLPFLEFFSFFFGTGFDIIKNTITFAHSFTRTLNESVSSKKIGGVPEWPNGADCNSAGVFLRWFESIRPHGLSLISC
jgi:hypothetical protein